MSRGRYRRLNHYGGEEIGEAYRRDEFHLKDEVTETLDAIENSVKEILNMLEPIKGIDLIDEVKQKLDELAQDIY
jgi:hypothetical protein